MVARNRLSCIRCKKLVNMTLLIDSMRTGGAGGDCDSDGGYGRFSLEIDCPWCGLRQKKLIKFGNRAFEKVNRLAIKSWDSLKTIEPEPSRKFKTLCWLKDLDL